MKRIEIKLPDGAYIKSFFTSSRKFITYHRGRKGDTYQADYNLIEETYTFDKTVRQVGAMLGKPKELSLDESTPILTELLDWLSKKGIHAMLTAY